MSQLGEPVAVAMADDLVDECPFSHDDNPPSKTNDLTNNPSKLGTNLKGGDAIQIKVKVRTNVRTMECGFGAHHVIPGDASLNKATQLLPWMKKGDLKSDIGYGVNHANNGIWLPGNYGWDPATLMKWGKLAASGGFEIQYGYAYAAMTATRTRLARIAWRRSWRPSSIRPTIHAASASAWSDTFADPTTRTPASMCFW